MKNFIILISIINFLLVLPTSSFGFLQTTDLKVHLSIDKRKIPMDKDSIINAEVCVTNTKKENILVVVDEPIVSGYDAKKRRLMLWLNRDYNEFDYRVTQLKLLKPNKSFVMKKSVPLSLFTRISEGKWHLKSIIGYIVKKDFEMLGITPKILKKKKSKDIFKINSDFSPHAFAEIQYLGGSNRVEIEIY